jgi:hypothetical protein
MTIQEQACSGHEPTRNGPSLREDSHSIRDFVATVEVGAKVAGEMLDAVETKLIAIPHTVRRYTALGFSPSLTIEITAAWPLAASAQQQPPAVIGFLSGSSLADRARCQKVKCVALTASHVMVRERV